MARINLIILKVFFDIDPLYRGEHFFHIHGIHYVQESIEPYLK